MKQHRVETSAIERYLDVYDVRSSHAAEVHAPASITYRALRDLDFARSLPVAVLLSLRGLPHFVMRKARPSRSVTLDTMMALGFVILEERLDEELVLGAVGKFWRPDSGLVAVTREEFAEFADPGHAKACMSFTVQERGDVSVLATETRVVGTDPAASRNFGWYWRAIAPFSGYIRRVALDQVKRAAEQSS